MPVSGRYNDGISLPSSLGELTVISGGSGAAYCMNIPYPAAPQTAVLLDGQSGQTILCESCDPNGRRDAEIEGYRLLLMGTSVLVYQAEDCSLQETLTLNPNCAPRSLWPSSREHRVYVICNSIHKYMEINYRFDNDPETADFYISTLLPPSASDASAPTNGTFISGDSSDGLNKEDYFVWIEDSLLHVYEAYGSRPLSPEGFPAEDFDIDCDTLIEVYARNEDMSGNPRFLLNCTKNDAQRLYDFELHSGQSPRELQPLAGPPIESPDGEFLVVVLQSRTSLAVYRTSDTSQNVPKTFSGVIEEARFDRSGILILVVRGKDIKLVNVKLFFSSGGAEGETSLPGSAANCPGVGRCLPHGFVQDSHYLVTSMKSNTFEGRVYDLNCVDHPPIIIPISDRPEAASFVISTSSNSACALPTSAPSEIQTPLTNTDTDTPTIASIGLNSDPRTGLSGKEIVAAVLSSVFGTAIIALIVVSVVCFYRRRLCRHSYLKPIPQSTGAGAREEGAGTSQPPLAPGSTSMHEATDSTFGSADPLFHRDSPSPNLPTTVSRFTGACNGEIESERRSDSAADGVSQAGDTATTPALTTTNAISSRVQQSIQAGDGKSRCAHGRLPILPNATN